MKTSFRLLNRLLLLVFLLVGSFDALSQTCTVPPSGLVAWWSGAGINDLVQGSGAALQNGATFIAGKVGQAFKFDGINDSVSFGTSLGNFGTNDFTIEFWIKTSSTRHEAILGKRQGCNSSSFLSLRLNTGRVALELAQDSAGNNFNSHIGTKTVNDGVFHHVAAVRQGTNATLFIDGVLDISNSTAGITSISNTVALLAGSGSCVGIDGTSVFTGQLDEITFYQRALSSNEIQRIFSADSEGKCYQIAPEIRIQPISQTANIGQSAKFSVTAFGSSFLSYTWFKNESPLSGFLDSTMTLSNVTTNDSGNYSVVVSNSFGSVTSSIVSLVVGPEASCIQPGMISWWTGDGNAFDNAGTNHGTLVGNATYGGGKVAQGFAFDGSGDAIDVGNPAAFQIQNFTIEAWIKRGSTSQASLTAGGGFFFCYSYGSGGYGFGVEDDGRLYLSRVGVSAVYAATALNDLEFHHVAVTKTNNTVIFYLDGIAYSTDSYDPGFTFGSNAAIGGYDNGSFSSFIGTIDELAIYNRVLSELEIQSIVNNGGKCSSPIIVKQPQSQSVLAGGGAILSVEAFGMQPLSYQWSFDGSDLPGKTNSILTINSVSTNEVGNYFVSVTNSLGQTNSSLAALDIFSGNCVAPMSGLISFWPANGSADDIAQKNSGTLKGNTFYTVGKSGQAFSFDGADDGVAFGNSTSLQVQNFTIEAWIKRDSLSQASQTPSGGLILSYGPGGYGFGMWDDGRVFLSKIDSSIIYSSFAITDVNFNHVAITKTNGTVVFYLNGVAYPASSYNPGFTFTTSAAIGARGDLLGSFWGAIDGLAFYNRALANAEIQTIFDSGTAEKCISAPVISTHPLNQAVVKGSNATFTVSVQSLLPVSYRWWFNQTPLANATNSSLALSNVQPNQAGNYFVTVSNIFGSMTSSNAELSLLLPPLITNQPQSQIVFFGGSAVFEVGASGSAPFTYQWQKEGTNILGATNVSLMITNIIPELTGNYRVVVSNFLGSATSQIATLSINPLITINGQAKSIFVFTNVASAQVDITTTFTNASVFYTLDGTGPDFGSIAFTGPFSISQSAVIRAIAYDSNFNSVEAAPVPVTFWQTYSLTVTNPGGGSVSLNPTGQVYRSDQTVIATATASNGWSFLRWEIDAAGSNPSIAVTMEQAKTIKAVFGTTLTASTTANGSIKFNPSLQLYPYGSLVQISGVPNANYSFSLWGSSLTGNTNPYTLYVTTPTPVASALFSALGANRFALTVIPNGEGTISVNPRANFFTNGQVVSVAATPIGTNRFLLWSGDANGKINPLDVTMNTSKIITANFTGGNYPIRFNPVVQTNGLLQFSFSGEPERNFDVEVSTNLFNWTSFLTLSNSTGTIQFSDSPTNSSKFYRASPQ